MVPHRTSNARCVHSPTRVRCPDPSDVDREVLVKQTNRSTAAILQGSDVATKGRADVFKVRERTRKRRLWRLLIILTLLDGYLWYRYLSDNPFKFPTLGPDAIIWLPIAGLFALILLMMAMPLFSGRSPHVVVRPEEIDAIGGERGSMNASPDGTGLGRVSSQFMGPGGSGMVNELLIQMQSFDTPPWGTRFKARMIEWVNGDLPADKRTATSKPT